jgi:hypothetical protein
MARAFLNGGGLDPVTVRAGTGGRKPSQWRTQLASQPLMQKGRVLCQRCKDDRAKVRSAESKLKELKLPSLKAVVSTSPGEPGSVLRRKALAAQSRLDRCRCR